MIAKRDGRDAYRANAKCVYRPAGEWRMRLSLRPNWLSVPVGWLTALSQVNFEVARDEVRAIIGPNGSWQEQLLQSPDGGPRPTVVASS